MNLTAFNIHLLTCVSMCSHACLPTSAVFKLTRFALLQCTKQFKPTVATIETPEMCIRALTFHHYQALSVTFCMYVCTSTGLLAEQKTTDGSVGHTCLSTLQQSIWAMQGSGSKCCWSSTLRAQAELAQNSGRCLTLRQQSSGLQGTAPGDLLSMALPSDLMRSTDMTP